MDIGAAGSHAGDVLDALVGRYPALAELVTDGALHPSIAANLITADHLKGLRHLHADHPGARRIVVCLEMRRRRTEDDIEILPAAVFAAELRNLL